MLVLDSLSPVGCKVEPPWIGLAPTCLIEGHLGTVEGQPLELFICSWVQLCGGGVGGGGGVTASETFLGWVL